MKAVAGKMLHMRGLLKSARDIIRLKVLRGGLRAAENADNDASAPPSAWRLWAGRHPRFARVLRVAGVIVAAYLIMPYVLIPVFRFVDPPYSALMLRQMLTGVSVRQKWVDIDDMSPSVVRSVVLAEDASFCQHRGVDWSAVGHALARAEKGETPRGASTLPMQTAKNLFLWPEQDYLRKALEAPIAYYMTLMLPKRRVAEIYLNIAEWGPGIFGVEAAARHHFNKSAAALSPGEAALLAAALPNPIRRKAGGPRPQHIRIAAHVQMRTAREARDVACIFD